MSQITDIMSLTLGELKDFAESIGEKPFRAAQIFKWLHQKRAGDFDAMTDLPLPLRERLKAEFSFGHIKPVKILTSASDGTVKLLFELCDGNHVETVLMRYEHGDSLCVSTQAGCKMGCRFCASTIAGFKRNLEPCEILGQLYETERVTGRKVSSIVLMGIGEPLDNFDNVVKFLQILSSPEGPCDEKRAELMPINNRYHIPELMKACRDYFGRTGRRISFEYALIEGENDSYDDAKALVGLMKGMPAHINVIPVNKIKERSYRSDRGSAQRFCRLLCSLGANATVRRTLGADINAACGQLRREYEEN